MKVQVRGAFPNQGAARKRLGWTYDGHALPHLSARTYPSRVQISLRRRETAGHMGGASDFVPDAQSTVRLPAPGVVDAPRPVPQPEGSRDHADSTVWSELLHLTAPPHRVADRAAQLAHPLRSVKSPSFLA